MAPECVFRLSATGLAALSLFGFNPQALAATYTRTATSGALNLPASWTPGTGATGTVPGSTDTGLFNSLSSLSSSLGATLTLGEIQVTNPTGTVTIGGDSAAVTLLLDGVRNSSGLNVGIDMSAATQSLTYGGATDTLQIGAPQNWFVKSGDTLTISGAVAGSANVTIGNGFSTAGGTVLLNTTASTYTGDYIVNDSTLSVQIGQAATTNFILENGATLTTNQLMTATNYVYANIGSSSFTQSGGNSTQDIGGNGNITFNTGNSTTFPANFYGDAGGVVTFGNNNGERFQSNTYAPFATLNFAATSGNIYQRNAAEVMVFGAIESTAATAGQGFGTPSVSNTSYDGVIVGSANTSTTYYGSLNAGTTGSIQFIKLGTGTLTLSGATQWTNGLQTAQQGLDAFDGGTVVVNELATGLFSNTSFLDFAGGTLDIVGKSSGVTTQTMSTVNLTGGGGGVLIVNPNGGASTTLTTGTLVDTVAGGTLNIQPTSATYGSGTAIITTTTAPGADGSYGPRITYGSDWATGTLASGAYTLTNYGGYNTIASGFAGGTDTTDDLINTATTGNVTLTGAYTTNLLKINNTAAQSLALSGSTVTLTAGGLLFTGSAPFTIGATVGDGTLVSGTPTNSDLIIQNLGNGGLTINSVIANGNGASTLTVAGTGTLTLAGANTYTGATYLTGGTTIITAANNLGAPAAGSAIVLNGGTLEANATFSLAGGSTAGILIGGGGGTFNVTGGNTLTVTSVIANQFGNIYGPLIKTGSGTLKLTALNTYNGSTIISGGVLSIASLLTEGSAGLGTAASGIGDSNNAGPALVLDGGTLQYTGATTTTDRTFTLDQNGGSIDASGSGAVNFNNILADAFTGTGNRTLTLTGVNTGANTLANGIFDASFGSGSGTTAIAKTGAGTWVLTGVNAYSGGTTVSAGTLQVGSGDATALGAGGALTVNGGTLDLNSNSITTGALSGGGGTITSTTGAASLNINSSTGSIYTFGGVIQNGGSGTTDPVSFSTQGTNTTILTGANAYTGATSIGGTTTLGLGAGGGLGNTAITVGSGATFLAQAGNVGIGTGTASLTLSGGSILSMVDGSVGSLALNGNLTIGGATAAVLKIEVNNLSPDSLTVSGNVTYGTAGGIIDVYGIGSVAPTSGMQYTLLTDPNGLGAAIFSLGTTTIIIGGQTYTMALSTSGNDESELLTLTNASVNYYFNGANSASWNNIGNFVQGPSGGTQSGSLGSVSNVFLTANSASNFTTETMDGNYTINSLNFTGAGTPAGTSSIDLTAGTGATLTLNAQNAYVDGNSNSYAAGIGLVVQAGSAAHTVGVNINLGGSQTWEIDNSSANPLTVNGVVADSVAGSGDAVIKTGVGTLILDNAETYDGGTFVNAGTLMMGSAGSLLTTGTLTVQGTGTFDLAGTSQTQAGLSDGGVATGAITSSTGTATLTLNNSSQSTFSGTITDAGTPVNGVILALTFNGPGNVTLSGSNSYNGLTTVAGGNLTVSNNYALGNPAAANGGLTISNATGTSIVSFTSANPMLASLNSSTSVGADIILGNATGAGSATTLNVGGAGTISTFTGSVSDLSGTKATAIGNLNVYGGGLLILTAANTFTGVTTITGSNASFASELELQNAGALQDSTLYYNNQGGTINFSTLGAATFAGLTGTQNLALTNQSGTALILTLGTAGAGNDTYTGNLSGLGGLIKNGSNTLTLGTLGVGGATYAGTTTINQGTLVLGGSSSLTGIVNITGANGVDGLTLDDNANVNMGTATLLIDSVGGASYAATGTLLVTGTASLTVGGLSMGNGTRVPTGNSVTVSGLGIITINGAYDIMHDEGSTAGNSTTNLNGGVLALQSFTDLGGGATHAETIVFNGGTLEALLGDQSGTDFLPAFATLTAQVNTGGAIINPNGNSITIGPALVHAGTGVDGGLTVTGTAGGTVILTAASTYTGATTIPAGQTLQLGTGAAGFDGTIAASSGISNSGSLVYDVGGGESSRVAISGTGSVTIEGPGSQIFTAVESYTGPTVIASGGTLQLGNGSTGNDGTIQTTSSLTNNGTLIYYRFGNLTSNLVISGSGNVQVSGPGSEILTSTNTYTGTTTVNLGGTLQLGNGTSGNDGSILDTSSLIDNGTLIYDLFANASFATPITGTGNFQVSGPGIVTLIGANSYQGVTTINSGATLQLGDGTSGDDGTIATSSGITDNGTLIYDRFGTLTSGLVITGSGNVTFEGPGTQILTAVSTFTGATTIAAGGTLQLGNGTAGHEGNITASSGITDNGNLIFDRLSGPTTPVAISGTGNVTVEGIGTEILTAAETYSGSTMINGGATLQLGNGTNGHDGTILNTSGITDNGTLIYNQFGALSSGVAISGPGNVTISGPGSQTLLAVNSYTGLTTINTGATLQLGNGTSGNDGSIASTSGITNNGSLIYNPFGNLSSGAPISGNGSVTKIGPGSQILSGNNSYLGATTVTAGTLIVSGSLTGTSAATVAANSNLEVDGSLNNSIPVTVSGELSGSGSVGPVTGTAATLAPGLSTITNADAGTLTANGAVSLDANSTFSIRLGASSSDQLAVASGDLVTLAGANLQLVDDPDFAQQFVGFIYVIVNGGTASIGNISGQFAQGSQITDPHGDVFNILYNVDASGDAGAGSDVDLQLVAIPEPGTWAMIVAGMGMLCVWQRSRRNQRGQA